MKCMSCNDPIEDEDFFITLMIKSGGKIGGYRNCLSCKCNVVKVNYHKSCFK